MRKNENGMVILKEGFFLKYLWGVNLWRYVILEVLCGLYDGLCEYPPLYPKNLCSLFWGSLFAMVVWICTAPAAIVLGLIYLMVLVTLVAGLVVASIAGFPPHFQNKKLMFHRYKMYGKHGKKLPVAPWEVLAPAFVIWLLIKHGPAIVRTTSGSFVRFFHSPVSIIIIGITVVTFLIVIFFRSTPWKITWEFMKATKRRICPLIEIEIEKRNT